MRKNLPAKKTKRLTVLERMDQIDAFDLKDRERLTQFLRISLADRSARVRSWAIKKVREQAIKDLEYRVLELLLDKSNFVRYEAVECLGDFHEGEGIAATWLYPLLHDLDMLTRVETIEALERIEDTSATHLIEPMLRDGEYLVRAYAACALSELGGPEYLDPVRRAAKIETEEKARPFFANALFQFGDQEQFSILLKLLSSDDYSARCASANALDDLPLTLEQMQIALKAVSRAERKFLYRADRTTMTKVKRILRKQLLEELAAVSTVEH
jgi:HEAT repeat protein